MADYPSPQSVGREFVRQYYTMLHEAPQFLHRFYSHDSSFLHGSVSDKMDHVAVGQQEIFQYIQGLNFENCHAKIRQVDSQMSINNSVVIQVVGELSNNGLPLRRFVQTFLLAPQSQKKFYVHNDIFRYQEDLTDPAQCESTTHESYQNQENIAYQDMQNGIERTENYEDCEKINSHIDTHHSTTEYIQEPENLDDSENLQKLTTNLPLEDSLQVMDALHINNQPVMNETINHEVNDMQDLVNEESKPEEEKQVETTPDNKTEGSIPVKLTWAAMASKNTGAGGIANQLNVPAILKPQATIKPELKINTPDSQKNIKEEDSGPEDEVGRGQIYPDNQQVFVGNLPHNMQDGELKDFFGKFGNVIDIRINRKTNSNLPNFGFVVFESPMTVQKILANRPLFKDGQRVNVEKKKPREELYNTPSESRGRGSGGLGGSRSYPSNYGNRVFNNSSTRGRTPRGRVGATTPLSNRSSVDDGKPNI